MCGTVWRAGIGTSDRAAAPSASKGEILTNATLLASEMVTEDPGEDPKMAPSRVMHSIYGRENPGRAAARQGNQPRGHRDRSPSMVTGFSHPPC